MNNVQDPISGDALGYSFIDSIISVYLIGMGEYNTETLGESQKVFTWIIFILSTLILQLIFMNMLIAIMGSTFSRVEAF